MAGLDGLQPDFANAVQQLINASGGRVWINSGYRSEEEQNRLWQKALRQYGSPEAARKWVAPPGKSNHGKGIAVDLGGDLALAARLAPRFGLHRPMSWEPWHFEPTNARGRSPENYTDSPDGRAPDLPEREREVILPPGAKREEEVDYAAELASMLGMDDKFARTFGGVNEDLFAGIFPEEDDPRDAIQLPVRDGAAEGPIFASGARGTGPADIDRFMAAIRSVESSGNYKAVGVPTKWGRATGAYQFLDSTWGNYGGYRRAMDAPPEVQDRRARELMEEYYGRFGNWDRVAASWFSGPGGKHQSPEVRNYVGKVMGRF
jgi:hypothetical protein